MVQQNTPIATLKKEERMEEIGAEVRDGDTTILFRSLPRKYDAYDLLAEIGLIVDAKLVDFVYLPWENQAHNMGYAFVNFTDPAATSTVARTMKGDTWKRVESQRRIKVLPASVHGLAANLRHCEPRISPDPEKAIYPLVFLEGKEVDFHEALHLLHAGLLDGIGSTTFEPPMSTPDQPPPKQPSPEALSPRQDGEPKQAKTLQLPKRALPKLPTRAATPAPDAKLAQPLRAPFVLDNQRIGMDFYRSGGSTAVPDDHVHSRVSTDFDFAARMLTDPDLDAQIAGDAPGPRRACAGGAATILASSSSSGPAVRSFVMLPDPESPRGPPPSLESRATSEGASPSSSGVYREDAQVLATLRSSEYGQAWRDVQVRLEELLRHMPSRRGASADRQAAR